MTFLKYRDIKFNSSRLARLKIAGQIITEYQKKGMTLTVRQLHYQFVSRDHYENTPANYNGLSRLISDGRLAGLISWTAIEDRIRGLAGRTHWEDAVDALKDQREKFLMNRWRNQEWIPEIWSEKDALSGVVAGVCHDLCVNFFATRGYTSQSAQWEAGQRLQGYVARGQRPIIFHLGDHDPSGIDMTRDNRERLTEFAGVPITVVRLALNRNQIEEYNPPPNFAKNTDPRFEDYAATHFPDTPVEEVESWEVDALNPDVIVQLIRDNVNRILDPAKWDKAITEEKEQLDLIDALIEQIAPPEDNNSGEDE